jgi:hypothetical protein
MVGVFAQEALSYPGAREVQTGEEFRGRGILSQDLLGRHVFHRRVGVVDLLVMFDSPGDGL